MTSHTTSWLKQPYFRRTLMAAALSTSLLQSARADYEAEILSENPVVYYRFDDGVTVDDLDPTVGSNLGSMAGTGSGTFLGTMTRGVTGAIAGDNAIAFDQVNPLDINFVGSMTVPNNAALNPSHTGTNPFTVECWVKPKNNVSTLLSPVNSMSFTTGRAGYLIYQNAGTWQLRLGNKASTTPVVAFDGGTVTPGVWQHIAFTYSGGTHGTATLYVNGVSVGSAVPPPLPTGTGYEANDNAPFVIGATSAPNRTYDGVVDEVAFHPSALSAARLLSRVNERTANPAGYQAHVLADSPAGYWRLNEAPFVPRTPPLAFNSGSLGASANGAYYAGSKNAAGGPSPSSGYLGFGATNSSLGLATANGHVGTTFNLNALTSYTVMGWVKRGALKSTRGGYFGQNDKLEFGDAGGGTQIEAWTGGSGSLYAPYSALDDQWAFIAYVADGSNNRLYVDGVQAQVLGGGVGGSSAFNFNVGGGGIFGATGDYFLGEIDEVAVFDKAVTPGRVKQLHDAALGNVAPGLVDLIPTVTPLGEIPEGQPYSLTVDPTGTPPFTYQWKLNGVDIPLATGKTYTVPNAAANSPNPLDPYSYTVVVNNGTNTPVTSEPADVYVTPTLKWTSTDPTNPGKWDSDTLSPSPLNWKTYTGNTPSAYIDFDYAVQFDDSAASGDVALTQDLVPKGMVFDNTDKTYTLTGPFVISSPPGGGATKNGTGTVVLANDIFNMDTLTVKAGTLQVGDGTNGTLSLITAVSVTGGQFVVNQGSGSVYESPTVLSGGPISFVGTGDLSSTATISGAGNQLFDRAGTVVVSGSNLPGGTVTINSGTVAFDGNQNANRLPASKVVTVNPGATMEVRGVNALPTGVNGVSPVLTQATLNVLTGNSAAQSGGSHAHLGNITLDGSQVILSYSGAGGVYSGESFQLNGNLTVAGSTASTIGYGTGGNAGNAGIAPSAGATHNVTVPNVAIGTDLTISAELENTDSGTPETAILAKAGVGTLRLADGISHTFSGTTQVNEGTLEATGSIAGPLVIGASGTVSPGTGSTATFTAGATTLGGTFVCQIDGAASDKLVANGNLVLQPGAVVNISMLSPATAPFYEIARCTGTLSGSLPTLAGTPPPGYALRVVSGASLILAPTSAEGGVTVSTPTPSGTEDFNTSAGGFTVSAPVSPQTDWTYSNGSWLSFGQDAGTAIVTHTSYLTTPIYSVTQAGPVELSVSHKYAFEVDYDAGAVEISVNGGAFTRLPGTAFTQNGYDGTLVMATNSALAGQEGFLNNSDGYPAYFTTIATLLANAAAGDTIQVRFMSATDDAFSAGGWEIDSFSITNALPNLLKLEWPFGVMQYSDNLQPPWTDLQSGSPLLIDMKAAPKRFFRVKP